MKKRLLGAVFAVGLAGLCGCGFTQKVVKDEAVLSQARSAGYSKGFKEGYTAGYEAAKADFSALLARDKELLVALKNYRTLLAKGAIAPPIVVAVHRPGEIKNDGQAMVGETTELRIVQPARFVNPNVIQEYLETKTYLIGVYPSYQAALRAKKKIIPSLDQRDHAVILETSKGNFALLVRSVSGKKYEFQGLSPLSEKEKIAKELNNPKTKSK